MRQSEQTAFLVADDNGIAGNGYGLDMTLHLSLKCFQRILNVNDLRLAAGLFANCFHPLTSPVFHQAA